MNVAIDSGNTLIKVGIFEGPEFRQRLVFDDPERARSFLQNFSDGNCIISTVAGNVETLKEWTKGFDKMIILSVAMPLPIKFDYTTPGTLGVDRLAAVCGALELFPSRDCLVVNTGTCVTFDFLDKTAVYHGGSISPGLKMRFKAMNAFTARLPLVPAIEDPPLIGNDTTTCLQSGVIWGMVEEINGIIERYREKISDLQVILSGGDGQFFENKMKASIFASPELVLRGLNRILLHNVSE